MGTNSAAKYKPHSAIIFICQCNRSSGIPMSSKKASSSSTLLARAFKLCSTSTTCRICSNTSKKSSQAMKLSGWRSTIFRTIWLSCRSATRMNLHYKHWRTTFWGILEGTTIFGTGTTTSKSSMRSRSRSIRLSILTTKISSCWKRPSKRMTNWWRCLRFSIRKEPVTSLGLLGCIRLKSRTLELGVVSTI